MSGTVLPWSEKYRPKTLDDVILPDESREKFKELLDNKIIPHLMFFGPPGTGKTTVAQIISHAITNDVHFVNASLHSGVDAVRTKIHDLCRITSSDREANFKVIILDEFCTYTPQAQTALKTLTEVFLETRFIFTLNHIEKIDPAMQSRSMMFHFQRSSKRDLYIRLSKICKAEKVELDKAILCDIINMHYPDIRSCVVQLERCSKGGKLEPLVENTDFVDICNIIK